MVKDEKDGARYIVRNAQYPQSESYSTACQTIADKLYSRNFRDVYSLIDFTAEHMRDKRIALRGNNPDEDDDYALPRSSAFMSTQHMEIPENRLWKAFTAFRKNISGDNSAIYRAAFYDESGKAPLKLTEISNLVPYLMRHPNEQPELSQQLSIGGAKIEQYDMEGHIIPDNHMIIHPVNSRNPETEEMLRNVLTPRLLDTLARMEPIVSQANESYKKAMDRSIAPQMRQEAAYQCYALLSHGVQLERGTATMSRIALDYLSHKVGFEVPYTKEDVDLNTAALLSSPQDFSKTAMQPVDAAHKLFDGQGTAREIRAWQKQVIRKRKEAEHDNGR